MTDDVCICRTIALSGWDTVQQAVNPTCPIHATYTAAEVKVLTETALRLGRKEAGEEIAESLEALAESIGEGNQRELLADIADIARDIASSPLGATWDVRSGVPGHQEVSEAVRSPQEPTERCARCHGRGYVADFTNWDEYHGEPKPKPCPDCTMGNTP